MAPLTPWIIDIAKRKSIKDYSDCTLVLVAASDPPFDMELPVFEKHCERVVDELKKITFRAKRTFLSVPALDKCFRIED